MMEQAPGYGRPHLSIIRLSNPYEEDDTHSSIPPPLPVVLPISSNREQAYSAAAPEVNPFDRQLSLIDPFSDRVTSILVWKNLTVLTREDKAIECCKRIRCWTKFKPKRQCLLNNISGAITGGLWAVMGTRVRLALLGIEACFA
jgi:hypothetical protein